MIRCISEKEKKNGLEKLSRNKIVSQKFLNMFAGSCARGEESRRRSY